MPMSSAGGSVASSLSAAGSVARYSLGMPVACQKVPHPGSRTGPGRMERVTDERRLAGPAQVPAHEPLLDADGIERLREAMRASRYTSAGIADRIGARTEPRAAVAAALTVEVLEAAGLLQRDGEGLRSAVDLEPYGEDWRVVSDLTGGPPAPDHVLGVGGASSCGSPTPPRAGTSGGPSSGWTGSTRKRSRRSGSGWSRCGAPGTRTPSSGSRTCARPWTSRSGTRWRPGSTARTAARGRPA